MGQRAPAHDIDDDREDDRADGEGADVDRGIAAADALERLDRDADRERGEKAGLGQRRHRLDLGVAERMIGVGGFVGLAHGEQRERACANVDRVMRAFRDQRERAGGEACRELERGKNCARGDRGRRRALLQPRVIFGRMARLCRQSESSICPGGFPLRPEALCSEAINEANPDEEPMEYLHTMIRVTDLKATIAFFELMGFVETRRIENEKGRFTLVFLAAPDDAETGEGEPEADRRAHLQLGPGGL